MELSVHIEDWELKQPFRTAGKVWSSCEVMVVELGDAGRAGRGEACGVDYLGESMEGMLAQIDEVSSDVRRGFTRQELLELLPAGGARNAIDCALWDLEAKISGRSIWQMTGIDPGPVTTVFTIGLEATPVAMAAKAKAAAEYPILKIKLDDDSPVECLAAIRAVRPDAELVVDVNQGWTFELLQEVLPGCVDLDVKMIEQPLKRDHDSVLQGFDSPVMLAADESCQHSGELEQLVGRYDMINIKLDKTGGLTEALQLAEKAQENGLQLMVGNMLGTSLGMAPAFVIAQLCEFVDIDGPLLAKYDRPGGLDYNAGVVAVYERRFWG